MERKTPKKKSVCGGVRNCWCNLRTSEFNNTITLPDPTSLLHFQMGFYFRYIFRFSRFIAPSLILYTGFVNFPSGWGSWCPPQPRAISTPSLCQPAHLRWVDHVMSWSWWIVSLLLLLWFLICLLLQLSYSYYFKLMLKGYIWLIL